MTVLPGDGYDVGDPASGSIPVERSAVECETTTAPTTNNTLVRTGVRPSSGPLALAGASLLLAGSLLVVVAARLRRRAV